MSLFDPPLTFVLTEAEQAAIFKVTIDPAKPIGGAQGLYKTIVMAIDVEDGVITLEENVIAKVRHYAYAYGDRGSYQTAFKAVVAAAVRAGWVERDGAVQRRRGHEGKRWDGKDSQ
jgi:hypothetical protein